MPGGLSGIGGLVRLGGRRGRQGAAIGANGRASRVE